MMAISRLVAGIVLLIFGVAALGFACDIKSDAQAQFSNLQCNNILGVIEWDLYLPEVEGHLVDDGLTHQSYMNYLSS